MGTVAELTQATDLVLRKVISGELTIVEARGMAQLITDRRKVLLTEEEEKRAEAQFLRMRAQADVRRRERSKDDFPPAA
jgi:hypothetical protein